MPKVLNDKESEHSCDPWEAPPLESHEGIAEETELAQRDLYDPVAAARREAEAELTRAKEQALEVLAEAKSRGYAEGLAQAETELQQKCSELESLVAAINEKQNTFFMRMEREVIELAIAIAAKVVEREVEAHPEIVVEQVRRCVRRLHERERLCVRVNPSDVETVRAAKAELMAGHDGLHRMDVVDDRRVAKGGCVVESQSGILDARLDRQLKEVGRVLLEASENGNGA